MEASRLAQVVAVTALVVGEPCSESILGQDVETPFGFVRGDANGDRRVDISDPIFTFGFLFLGDREPGCMDAADANDDGTVNISDVVETLNSLFMDGVPLAAPSGEAGADPTPDDLDCAPDDSATYSFRPMQCVAYPWHDFARGPEGLAAWLESQGVVVNAAWRGDLLSVCAACSCPSSFALFVNVSRSEEVAGLLLGIGFSER
jgi:hypothetical protein